jgi:cytochrome c551/c552
VFILLLAGAVASGALACSGTGNAFEAARSLDATSEAQALLPATPTAVAALQTPAAGAGTPHTTGNATRGQALFTQQGCAACHSTGENTVVGPGLKGIGARAATRANGANARDYLIQSVREPAAFLAPGFNNLMPAIFAGLPQQDVDDLVAFLETLK